MATDDTPHGRDLEREARLVYALYNLIAADIGHYGFDKPVPLFSADDPAFIIASRARIAALIVPGRAVDAGFAQERAWVERSGYDLVMLVASTRDEPRRVEVDVLRATAQGAVDEGRLLLWDGEDDVRAEAAGLWLIALEDTGAELERALLVTGRGLLVSERPPHRDGASREAGLRSAARIFGRLMTEAKVWR